MSITFTEDELDAIARHYRRGATIAEAAVTFRCSPAAIRNALKLRGVASRRRQHGLHPRKAPA